MLCSGVTRPFAFSPLKGCGYALLPGQLVWSGHTQWVDMIVACRHRYVDNYGGWLGPLSAILQFQLPLYFHPISTLFPLWTLTSTLFPLYFHSEFALPLYFHSTSTLLPFYFHPGFLLPLYLPSSWIGNGWLG